MTDLEKKRQELGKHKIRYAEQSCDDDGYDDHHDGETDCLLTGRPIDMAHFGARVLDVFGEFHDIPDVY